MADPQVAADISMSLDGFVAGPNDDVDPLHQWLYDLASWRKPHGLEGGQQNQDAEVLEEAFRNVGAVVMGRRMFDLAEEPWGENPPFHVPVFVLTHRAREPLAKEGGTTFTFVTDGIEPALRQAQEAANGKNVSVAGGASTIQQFLREKLLDEIQVHLVPVFLGDGIRLFDQLGGVEMEATRVIDSGGVTHLKFRVNRQP
jgi:dihydrofolate reductase